MESALDKSEMTPETISKIRGMLKSSVRQYPVGTAPEVSPQIYRRDLLRNFIYSRPIAELQELTELENMFAFLKGTMDDLVYKRALSGKKEPTPTEIAYFKLLKETLVDLHKLKYGEKRTNLNVGANYETIQEMMFGTPVGDENGKKEETRTGTE